MRRVLGHVKSGSKHVAVLAEGVELAAAWHAEMRKQSFRLLGETSIIRDTHGLYSSSPRISNLDIHDIISFLS